MARARFAFSALFVILLAAFPSGSSCAADAESVVGDALAAAGEIPAQAAALADLAWGRAPADPEVAAFARKKLVEFGALALPTLRANLLEVRPVAQADVLRALLEAQATVRGKVPPEYMAALEEAAWFGTEETRRVAIPELARYRYVFALLTIVDAAYEMPSLAPLCIEALGQLGDDRARFFLEKQMQEGKGEIPSLAATALARLGARALLPLKAGMRSDRRVVRESAARAFVPVAGPEDASALHEYAAEHRSDDAATVRMVQEAAVMLQKIQEAKEAAESSSSERAD